MAAPFVHLSGRLPQGRCGLKWQEGDPGRTCEMSPSARKVWIEIVKLKTNYKDALVAFRKEGVD